MTEPKEENDLDAMMNSKPPPEEQEAFRKEQEKEKKERELEEQREKVIKTIEIDDSNRWVLLGGGIVSERRNKNTWKRTRVYSGRLKPIARMNIDDITVYKYIGDTEQIDDMQNIIRKVKKGGGVLAQNRIADCLNAVFLDLPEIKGHATYGVYRNGDKLELCLDAMPLKDMQRKIQLRCGSSLNQEMNKETLQAYFDTLTHWHPYETLPSMGASAISPFALILRKEGKLVATIWHFSPVSHLGKSTVQKIFSMHLFSIYPHSGDAVDSKFRLASAFDGICGYCIVDEADKVEWSKLESILKEAPENYLCSLRGTADLGVIEFHSRAVLGINGNRFKITDKTVLVRIYKIEYDSSVVGDRAGNEAEVEKLSKTISELMPIGWRLTELYLEGIQHSMDVLLERISKHEKAFKESYKKFIDPRRATSWAITYEGLKAWEMASIKYGLEWRAPSYEEFTKDVIDKIETSTRETGEIPIADFLHWWEMWKVQNKKFHIEEDGSGSTTVIKGEGEIWAGGKNVVHGDKNYRGDIITNVILREYQKDKSYNIDTLTDIAKTIQMTTGISKDKLLKHWRIGANVIWGVFLPSDLWKYKGMKGDDKE